MKEIRETKLVEQTTVKYIAYNGKEFDKEIDCKVYEADQHRRDTEVELKAIMTNIEVPCLEWMGYAVYKTLLNFTVILMKIGIALASTKNFLNQVKLFIYLSMTTAM